MKHTILALLFALPIFAEAQITYPGPYLETHTFTFSNGDSVNLDGSSMVIDTSSATLWKIGHTLKPVFSNDTTASFGIMTDTLQPYPRYANDFFLLKITLWQNTIIDIWHKYQMDSLHAGGIIEFSTDTGASWMNVADCPYADTQNFYSQADTILSGQPAFTGTSNGEQLSRFQFLNCYTEKQTATSCPIPLFDDGSVYVRFRFVSDSATDTLSGWMIDSIKVEFPGCGSGGVKNVSTDNNISIFPNPATNELIITSSNKITTIAITNLIGQTVFTNNYNTDKVQIDVADLPPGMYLVKINCTEVRKFVKE